MRNEASAGISKSWFLDPRIASFDSLDENITLGRYADHYREIFGERGYAELSNLVRESRTNRTRSGERVVILPGIMGSTLGTKDDTIWLDLLDVPFGRLFELGLTGQRTDIHALDVFPYFYWFLRLRLEAQGFECAYFPYDWRITLPVTGHALNSFLTSKGWERPHVVAHSMGGLVYRAALKQSNRSRFGKIVMLATPHGGSFVPIKAFRGKHSVTNTLEKMDPRHDALDYAEGLYKTFPGLHELIAAPGRFPKTDLFDIANWPTSRVTADARMLQAAKKTLATALSNDTTELSIIVGINQPTTVEARKVGNEFEYTDSSDGDGVVPREAALLDGARHYFIEEEHGALPNNKTAALAVADILKTGATTRLPTQAAIRQSTPVRRTDSDLEQLRQQRTTSQLAPSQEQRRLLLHDFIGLSRAEGTLSPEMRPGRIEEPVQLAEEVRLHGFVVGRKRQRRLDLHIIQGDITDVDARAVALGLFHRVRPGGAASAIDEALDGALSALVARRMFNGHLGEVHLIPALRRQLRVEYLSFLGLGSANSFDTSSLRSAAANLMRTLCWTRVEELALVQFGASAGLSVRDSLAATFEGFFDALNDVDRDGTFRTIKFCEADPQRFRLLREEFIGLLRTPLFEDVEVTVFEEQVRAAARMPAKPARLLSAENRPTYMFIELASADESGGSALNLRGTFLTAGGAATSFSFKQQISRTQLDRLLAMLPGDGPPRAPLKSVGRDIAALLPQSARQILADPGVRGRPLVIVHDALASKLPWEALSAENVPAPALEGGMSRLYATDDLSVAKWLNTQQASKRLRVLVAYNPTNDLPGAEAEGERITRTLQTLGGSDIDVLRRNEVTRSEILRRIGSGKYDVLHYAGHAFFDQHSPGDSGLMCSDAVLKGADLADCNGLPSLIVFNACESARVRKRLPQARMITVGVAEALLRGGVANFIGTYWPVGDSGAKVFAESFYSEICVGRSLGAAILTGRKALATANDKDWANYIHYGDPAFVVKYQ